MDDLIRQIFDFQDYRYVINGTKEYRNCTLKEGFGPFVVGDNIKLIRLINGELHILNEKYEVVDKYSLQLTVQSQLPCS